MLNIFKRKRIVIRTKIRGVTFNNPDGSNRQKILKRCRKGESLVLKHTPIPGHPNAVSVLRKNGELLGFISAELCSQIAEYIKAKNKIYCQILQVTGGRIWHKKTRGCNIKITIR